MKDTYFHGVWRMDWGFGNANKTAVLIAILMIGIWALAYIKKWGFWAALAVFTGLGVCLIHTASRGGLLAVCSGLTAVFWHLPKPWPVPKISAVIVGIVIIITSSVYLRTYARYGEGIEQEDPSINNRLSLWSASPRMMVDAPSGWGIGNSGKAYMQWYQSFEHHEQYRTLVNSHLTWLVECGWPMRFLYVLAWLSILALTFPLQERPWTAIPFGIWIAFFVGSLFSSVAESAWLWAIPVGGLFIALGTRWYCGRWIKISVWLVLMGLSILSLVVLFAIGSGTTGPKILACQNQIILGQGDPKTWILVDPHVLGSDFGRTLRQHSPPYSVGLITSAKVPKSIKGDTLIICGSLKKEGLQELDSVLDHFHKILVVNPTFYPQEFKVDHSFQINAIFGEFSQSSSINEWKVRLGERVAILRGTGDFISKWPTSVLNLN